MARVAHLERLSEMRPAQFLYTSTRHDWDERLAQATPGVERLSFPQIIKRVWAQDYRILEIPEPLAIAVLPRAVLIALIVKVKRLVRRGSGTSLVFYAIENLDQVGKVLSRFAVPATLVRRGLRMGLSVVFSESSRVVFGTAGSLETYKKLVHRKTWHRIQARTEIRLIPGLPAPIGPAPTKDEFLVCFLGSFEYRKGIQKVMSAWPLVGGKLPGSRLILLGHGPLIREVRRFADSRHDAQVQEDPTRDQIRKILNAAHCLVLPSQRTPVWREQIGLPILEALSAGCEVVTTSETGMSDWLLTHGHRVLDASASEMELATSIIEALNDDRSASAIRKDLPSVDGRIEADRWMFQTTDGVEEDFVP